MSKSTPQLTFNKKEAMLKALQGNFGRVSKAAAAAQISLTDRDRSSRVVLATRHRAAGSEEAMIDPCDAASTLAIYMPGSDYSALQRELLAAHWPPQTECIIVSAASLPNEQIMHVRLAELSGREPLPAPAVVLILPQPAL